MAFIPQAVQYLIFVISIMVSPIDSSFMAYIDGITLTSGAIETLTISHDSADASLHLNYTDDNGDERELLQYVSGAQNTVTLILPTNEKINFKLTDYISPETIKKLSEREEGSFTVNSFTIDVKEMGKVYVTVAGSVVYLRMEADPETILVVHE